MNNHRLRRLTAIVLAVVLIAGTAVSALVIASESYEDPTIVLLDAMLTGDRQWVTETIVEDNRTNNPYAKTYTSTKISLMSTALSQVENKDDPDYRAIYSVTLDALTKFHYEKSWADDLENTLSSLIDDVLEFLGQDENAVFNFVDDLKKTTSDLKYEGIIEGVFTDTYTASWGEEVNHQEAALEQLTSLSDALSRLEELTGIWSTIYTAGDGGDGETILSYSKDVVKPLISNGRSYYKTFQKMSAGEQEAAKAALTSAGFLAAMNWIIQDSADYGSCTSLTADLFEYVAGDKAIDLVEKTGSAIDFANGAVKQYIFLHQLLEHYDTFHDTLIRVSEQADRDDLYSMSTILENFAGQMDDALYSDQISYNLLVDRLSAVPKVQKNLKLSTAIEAGLSKVMSKVFKSVDFKTLSNAFTVGMFFVDEATGLKNTCIKLSEMKYLRDMINEVKKVYYSDLELYQDDKTPENARKVLTDLMLLQRLRLRGEHLAHDMVRGQLNSVSGRLLSGSSYQDWVNGEDTEDAKNWTAHYQRSIDCLIGATLNPVNCEPFVVGPDQTLVIFYDNNYNTYRGGYSDGTALFEMQYRVMAGIQLNGGKLTIHDLSVPSVVATDGSSLTINAETAQIGELTQTGNMTLTVNYRDLDFQTCMELENAQINTNGYTLSSPDMTLNGAAVCSGGLLKAGDLHLSGASVTGAPLDCTGSVDAADECYLEDLTLCGTGQQTVTGAITLGDLTLNNSRDKGIRSDGKLLVTGVLSDPENIDMGGITLSETASIRGTQVASDITMLGTDISHSVRYRRTLTAIGDCSVRGGQVDGALSVRDGTFVNYGDELTLVHGLIATEACLELSEPVTAKEDTYLRNITFAGTGVLTLEGETLFSGDNLALEDTVIHLLGSCDSEPDSATQLVSLHLLGNAAQTLGLRGSVTRLEIANTSLAGVEVTEELTITGSFTAKDQRITQGKHLILTGNASAGLENARTDLHIRNWQGEGILGLNGTLYASGDNRIATDLNLRSGIRQTDGTVTLAGASVACREGMECAGSWIIDPDSSLVSRGDSHFAGTIQNEGLLCTADLTLAGTLSGGGTLELTGDLDTASANTFGCLVFSGSGGQTVTGQAITVTDLYNRNTSGRGVTLEAPVYVTGTYENHGNLLGIQPVQTTCGSLITEDTELASLHPEGDLFICQNVTLTVLGDLELTGALTLDPGAKLIVLGDLAATGSTVTTAAGSEIRIRDNLRLSGTGLLLDGSLTVRRDAILSGGTVQGSGRLALMGDLDNTSLISGLDTLVISGQAPQRFTGNDIHTAHLIVENRSSGGVALAQTVYYSESLSLCDGCNISEDHLMEE